VAQSDKARMARDARLLTVGTVVERWTVVGPPITVDRRTAYPCRCACGTERVVGARHLLDGRSHSCGCYRLERSIAVARTHGATHTSEYTIWLGIIARCKNAKEKAYKNYGARGIRVCPEWRESFEQFIADVGQRPSPNHSLDRIDNNGDYEPGNCRWATDTEQQRNRRGNVRITAFGETVTLAEWSERTGIGGGTIRNRLRSGWDVEVALTKPTRKQRTPDAEAEIAYRRQGDAVHLILRGLTNHEIREFLVGLWATLDEADRADHLRELDHYAPLLRRPDLYPDRHLSKLSEAIRRTVALAREEE
jgi:hypothetical protein